MVALVRSLDPRGLAVLQRCCFVHNFVRCLDLHVKDSPRAIFSLRNNQEQRPPGRQSPKNRIAA
jgi:hypothetical protein